MTDLMRGLRKVPAASLVPCLRSVEAVPGGGSWWVGFGGQAPRTGERDRKLSRVTVSRRPASAWSQGTNRAGPCQPAGQSSIEGATESWQSWGGGDSDLGGTSSAVSTPARTLLTGPSPSPSSPSHPGTSKTRVQKEGLWHSSLLGGHWPQLCLGPSVSTSWWTLPKADDDEHLPGHPQPFGRCWHLRSLQVSWCR